MLDLNILESRSAKTVVAVIGVFAVGTLIGFTLIASVSGILSGSAQAPQPIQGEDRTLTSAPPAETPSNETFSELEVLLNGEKTQTGAYVVHVKVDSISPDTAVRIQVGDQQKTIRFIGEEAYFTVNSKDKRVIIKGIEGRETKVLYNGTVSDFLSTKTRTP